MLGSYLILLSIGSTLAGVSIRMPYLNPAGVTYSSLEAAIPAAFLPPHGAGGFAYSSAYSLPTAPVGFAPAAHLAVAHAAPVAVAHAAPLVPAVQHVPAVANVPVTKYEAQPAVIQNLVDVHKPKVATRKFEIRRPAIEKEFFDVEERIVVRPAGKALVELDQPVSKQQRGPTVVSPALPAVKTVAVAQHLPVTHVTHGLHAPVLAATPQPIHVTDFVQPVQFGTPTFVSSTPAPPLNVPVTELPSQPVFSLPPQQNFPQPPQNAPSPQFDDSDSVSIENPEIVRARVGQLQQPNRDQFVRTQQLQSDFLRSQQTQSDQRLQTEQLVRQQQVEREQFDRQQQLSREQFEHQQQSVQRRFQIEQIEQLFQQPQPFDRRFQPSGLDRQFQADLQARLLQQQPQRFDQGPPPQRFDQGPPQQRSQQVPQPNSQELLRTASLSSTPRPQELQRVQANFRSGEVLRQSYGLDVVPSFRVSADQSASNQQRLIDLLTARGGVTEVRGPGENTVGGDQVRTRVLSVTPAPYNAGPQDEKVNTRRIVVNRPITTVEEVDVVEPFTKVERVAVNQPALVKTAKFGIASVPTSVPFHTYAYAV